MMGRLCITLLGEYKTLLFFKHFDVGSSQAFFHQISGMLSGKAFQTTSLILCFLSLRPWINATLKTN